jgi:hypothetical protein
MPGVRFWTGLRECLYFTMSRAALEPIQHPIEWVLAGYTPGVKVPGSEADHSPPYIAEVKNGGAVLPLLHSSSWRDA